MISIEPPEQSDYTALQMIPSITGHTSISPQISPKLTPGSRVAPIQPDSWRLEIPAGIKGNYRLAQLDDYTLLSRKGFPWQPSVSLTLCARASSNHIQGTWGFGLWNDPFSFSMGFGGGVRRLPALPNAVWFFFASPQNHLTLRDDLPASGNLASIFQSSCLPEYLLIPGMIALPFFTLPPVVRLLRRWVLRLVRQETTDFISDVTQWHQYRMVWEERRVYLALDGKTLLESTLSPHCPLGLVIWIDNQFLALIPNGHISYGNLETQQPAWLEIRDIHLERY